MDYPRPARERQARLEQALEELAKIRQAQSEAQEKESARVSLSDPTSRIMKAGDGGYGPNFFTSSEVLPKQRFYN